MSRTIIRDFHDDDLDGIVRLYEDAGHRSSRPVYALSEVIASCREDHAVVAVQGEQLVGAAVGRAAHAQGWIVFFGLTDDIAGAEVGAGLLDELEHRMAPLGLGKLSIIVPQDADRLDGLTANGFEVRNHLRYLERQMPVQRRELDLLAEVGGRILPRNLWTRVSGMRQEKQLLEERLVTPLANPDLADRFGVVPPSAVMLFGPPGTGKTTFARAVASRLDWPFVELFPSRLSDTPGGLAAALRSTFEVIGHLEHAVVFIDEVEEIASRRGGIPPSPTQGVTNELLKLVADFREHQGRLLICATNFVRALDAGGRNQRNRGLPDLPVRSRHRILGLGQPERLTQQCQLKQPSILDKFSVLIEEFDLRDGKAHRSKASINESVVASPHFMNSRIRAPCPLSENRT